jgi:serine/threonine protein kinase
MADYRDFFSQFIQEKGLTRDNTFTEPEFLSWFETAHPDRKAWFDTTYPDRKASNIHHQLLKKTTNYPGRVRYLPPPNATDDLFFAINPKFTTFRLYMKGEDPQPHYLLQEGSKDSSPKRQISRSDQVTKAKSIAVQSDENNAGILHQEGEFSEGFRFAIENKFPYPIAKAFYQLRGIYDFSAQVNQLANILGITLEYLALIALAEYLAGESRDQNLTERLTTTLRQPVSHGAWAGVLRELLSFFANQSEPHFLNELHETYLPESSKSTQQSLKSLSDDLVKTRNDIIKRSIDQLPTIDTIRGFKRQVIRFLQAISFLTDYQLISVESSETQGDIKTHVCNIHMGFHDSFSQAKLQCDLEIQKRRVAMLDLRTHRLLYLYPLFAVDLCPVTGCGNRHWFRFDKSDGRRVEYLATNGHKLRDDAAGVDLANLLRGPWGGRKILIAHYMVLDSDGFQHQLSEGQVVDAKYRVIEHLRRGGMADLYKVLDVTCDKLVALKLLPFQLVSDRSVVQRFRQEALQATQFDHPHITRVLEYGESLVDHYLVMELANGWSLQNGKVALDAGELSKPLDVTTCVSIVRQVCDSLDYIHASRVIHRDIKPSNILLFDNNVVKVCDFGIARASEAMTLTLTGLTMGTPEYSSPEQIEGKRDLTFASDVYSLGVVMFELLTGMSPFKRATPMASAFAQVKDRVPDPRSIKRDMPVQLSSIVVKCLQKDPTKRYATAKELAMALDNYSVLAPKEPRPRKPKREKIHEEDFYNALASKDLRLATKLRAFIEKARSRGLSVDRGNNSLILKFKTDNRIELNLGIFKTDGTFLNRRIAAFAERIGHPEIGEEYLSRLASIIPDAYLAKYPNKWVWTVRKVGMKGVPIGDLLELEETWFVLIEETVIRLKKTRFTGSTVLEVYANYSSDRNPPSRVWADAVDYGFFSGGGSKRDRQALESLKPGDRLWVNSSPHGFVGVGIVLGSAEPANQFTVTSTDGRDAPVLQFRMRGDYRRQWADDPELSEHFVRVKWLDVVPVERAVKETGLYGTPHTVARPTSQLWRHTLERLKLAFPHSDIDRTKRNAEHEEAPHVIAEKKTVEVYRRPLLAYVATLPLGETFEEGQITSATEARGHKVPKQFIRAILQGVNGIDQEVLKVGKYSGKIRRIGPVEII